MYYNMDIVNMMQHKILCLMYKCFMGLSLQYNFFMFLFTGVLYYCTVVPAKVKMQLTTAVLVQN